MYANDLNPRSFHYLRENIKLNKVCLSNRDGWSLSVSGKLQLSFSWCRCQTR